MKKRILAVDDDETILELIKIILEDRGYLLDFLSDSKRYRDALISNRYDLAIVDIWMPVVDGKEIANYIKKHDFTAHIPVILMSALNNVEEISEEVHADAYLAKPFDINHLTSLVDSQIIQSHRL
ncbi:response regulator [Candidatus Roizmanbacteria bacterium]|nr:response regulator [Candidatus Roizmanbacteria bacterium]